MIKTKEEMMILAAPYFGEGADQILATADGHFFAKSPSGETAFYNHLNSNKVEGYLLMKQEEVKKTKKKVTDNGSE